MFSYLHVFGVLRRTYVSLCFLDEIGHYEVQRFQDMGMSQDQFVEELMVNFRYTVYLKKAPSADSTGVDRRRSGSKLGRLKLASHFFDAQPGVPSLASDLHIIDRAGYLSRSFAQAEQLALQRQSTSIEFAHYGLPGDTRFKHIVMPLIAPCLSQLSYYPTLQALHDANRAFALRERRDFDEVAARRYLIQIISYLEMLNLVVFERYKLSSDDEVIEKAAAPQLSRSRGPSSGAAQTSAAEVNKKVGGLRITSRSSPVSPTSKEESSVSTIQPSNLEDGVTQEMVDALQRSDQSRDFTGLQEGHGNELKEDDVVVDMLKRQTAENQQILSGL